LNNQQPPSLVQTDVFEAVGGVDNVDKFIFHGSVEFCAISDLPRHPSINVIASSLP
jgi:hypothetical protein